ncbi:UNVERIFIED_CONTAM: hypothetical protein PYX00_007180 [Menopon gallinae]|uniref:Uncharacterized protein n=1 Tax=Menopon gallinae TaxID=328185 RepID=A0AAW2HIQ4_9NEOP
MLGELRIEPLLLRIGIFMLRWFGHVLRLPPTHLVKWVQSECRGKATPGRGNARG